MAAGFKLTPRGSGDFKTRYRPMTLGEVVPTAPIRLLKSIVVGDTGAQVFMFEGLTGTGKTTTARILSRAFVCESQDKTKPCLECEPCKKLEMCGDFVELNIANQRGIDDMRQLIDEMKMSPFFLKHRIYILDEVHQLSPHAQQILLKALEEPPSHVYIFMCTTDTSKLNRMLRSRTMTVKFKRISRQQANRVIDQIVSYESLEEPDADTKLKLWQQADGSVRDLMNIIQQYSNGTLDLDEDVSDTGISPDAKALARALIDKDWRKTSELLKTNTIKSSPESIRIGVCSYLRAICLNQKSINSVSFAAGPLGLLIDELTGSSITQYNELVLKCMRACYKK